MAIIGGTAATLEYELGQAGHAFGAMADAWHLASDTLSDVVAFGVTIVASYYASNKRAVLVFGAYVQATLLAAAAVLIGWEIYTKFSHPDVTYSWSAFQAGLIGLVGNGIRFWILNWKKGEWNITRVIQNKHVRGDLAYSAGVVIEGLLIGFFGLGWLDWIVLLAIFVYVSKLAIEAFAKAHKGDIHAH